MTARQFYHVSPVGVIVKFIKRIPDLVAKNRQHVIVRPPCRFDYKQDDPDDTERINQDIAHLEGIIEKGKRDIRFIAMSRRRRKSNYINELIVAFVQCHALKKIVNPGRRRRRGRRGQVVHTLAVETFIEDTIDERHDLNTCIDEDTDWPDNLWREKYHRSMRILTNEAEQAAQEGFTLSRSTPESTVASTVASTVSRNHIKHTLFFVVPLALLSYFHNAFYTNALMLSGSDGVARFMTQMWIVMSIMSYHTTNEVDWPYYANEFVINFMNIFIAFGVLLPRLCIMVTGWLAY